MIAAYQIQLALAQRRALGRPARRRKPPRNMPPIALEREYGRALREIVRVTIANYAEVSEFVKTVLVRGRLDADRADGTAEDLKNVLAKAAGKLRPTTVESIAVGVGTKAAILVDLEFRRQIKAALAIDVIGNDPKQGTRVKLFAASNAQLIEKISVNHMARITELSYEAIQKAQTITTFAEAIQKAGAISERQAVFIARDQIGSLYGQINAERQKDIGVKKFIWRSSHDERVRPKHVELDGQTFSYDDLPYEGLPGEPILCRCYAEPDFADLLGE
jgi:SPP1 gp7 family putative phage head morphogenesis protein